MEKLLSSFFMVLKTMGVLKIKFGSMIVQGGVFLIRHIVKFIAISLKALSFCFFETIGRGLTKKYWSLVIEQPAIIWVLSGIMIVAVVGFWVSFNVGVTFYYG